MKSTQWDSFQLFLQVARLGGLTGAQASSGLSPATVGRRMLDLEQEIGRALFPAARPATA
jgi:DNA-binding transcriptional LysR family regulator